LTEVDGIGVTLVGHPVVQAHILESFDEAFKATPFYTLLGVFSVMLLYIRKPGRVILSSLPTIMGVVLIFGVMGATGLDFNVVNFVGLPISVGIGAVYGVHALHRIEETGGQSLLSTSTGKAILLSGLTTIAGFASLMTARHGGLSSFGFVISVGVMANLLVSLVVLPAVCRWADEWSGRNLSQAEEDI
ncbi:MAG: MMPL family transporter, partial [Candidatus Eremiobacteraeota bacterium]|nr:MMPL family transporter [Candidatus Eremiobacteraeota bacterium]